MKKILTLVIDGFGLSDETVGNAVQNANMPNYNGLLEKFPNCKIETSGSLVGLPEGQAGNEIVGYKTIAAGQILKQRSTFVHEFVEKDNLATNTAIKNAVLHAKKHKSTIHIIGLMSDAGINSNISDTIKIIEFLMGEGVNVAVDFISDGKDVEAKSVLKYVELIESTGAPAVSVCGRYYAMDEENKWDRTKIYYDLIRNGIGLKVKELRLALKNCYIRNITDEYLPPILVEPDHNIKDNDVVIWTNYQSDGAKQILMALTNPSEVTEFKTRPLINVKTLIMYPVDSKINATVLINEEDDTSNNLGLYLSKLDLTQARIASESNFENVTYHFNGDRKQKLPKCNNYLIDPPNIIPDKKEELVCAAITKQIIKCMEKDTDFILASLDGASIIGRTGNYEKTVKMLEFIDECLGKIIESAELNFYTIVLLSNYGKTEYMIDSDGKAVTKNTCNKVPFLITDSKIKLIDGSLTSVAPTILTYMDISIPESMKNSKILIKE